MTCSPCWSIRAAWCESATSLCMRPQRTGRWWDAVTVAIKENGKINVGQVRDRFNTSRKYALALLEHLDQQRITRRVGDDRVLR